MDGSLYARVNKNGVELDSSLDKSINPESIYSNLNATSIDSGISSSLGEQQSTGHKSIYSSLKFYSPEHTRNGHKRRAAHQLNDTNETVSSLESTASPNLSRRTKEPNYLERVDLELNGLIERLESDKRSPMPKSKEEQELDDLLTDMLLEIRSTGNQNGNENSNENSNRKNDPNSGQNSDQNNDQNKPAADNTPAEENKENQKENQNLENQSTPDEQMESSQTGVKQLCGGGRPASGHLANDEQPVGSPRFLKKPSYEGQDSNQATTGQPFSYGIQTASPALQRRRLLSERTEYVSESDPNQEPNRSAADRRSEENLIALLQKEAADEQAGRRPLSTASDGNENLDWLERQQLKLKSRREGELWRDRFSKERSLMQELRSTVKPKQQQFNQPLHIDTGNQSINIPIDRSGGQSQFDQRYQRSQSANYDRYPVEDPEFRTVNTGKKTMQKGVRGDRSGSSTPVRPSTPTNQQRPVRSQSPAPSISSLNKQTVHATNLPVREEHASRPTQSGYGTIGAISRGLVTNIPINRVPANSPAAPLAASSPKPQTVDETDLAELIHTASSPVYAHSRPTSSARTVSRQSNETQPVYRTHQPQIYQGYQSTPIRVRGSCCFRCI